MAPCSPTTAGITIGNLQTKAQAWPDPSAPQSMRFDLTDLQLFVHILDCGTLTAAAGRAHMTLASPTERVPAMEAQPGCPLLPPPPPPPPPPAPPPPPRPHPPAA